MELIQYFSTHNNCYKKNVSRADNRYATFQRRGPKGLMLHSVGIGQSSAKVFADNWNRPTSEVAVHAVLQADGTVYQCLPWSYRGWHAGSDANNTHVGVEMTEPDCIRYNDGANFVCLDKGAAQTQVRGTYKTAVELFAQLCAQFCLDPLVPGVIISHQEGCENGVASNHSDPEHLWTQLGLDYTMDTFRRAVADKMKEENEMRYEKLKDVTSPTYHKTLDKLIAKGIVRGKEGSGEDMILDLGEDAIRILVYLDRNGNFD